MKERTGTVVVVDGQRMVRLTVAGSPCVPLPGKLLKKLGDRTRQQIQPGATVKVQVDAYPSGEQFVVKFLEVVQSAPGAAPARPRRGGPGSKLQAAASSPRPAPNEQTRQARRGNGQTVGPYTFLPFASTPPADRHRPAFDRTFPWDEAEGSFLYSGRFRLRLEVASPLAIYGSSRSEPPTHQMRRNRRTGAFEPVPIPGEGRQKGNKSRPHEVISLPRDDKGWPSVPGATLKGAMRSWLEAITSSPRLHTEQPVAWRATSLKDVRPGRIRIHRQDKADKLVAQRGSDLDRLEKALHNGLEVSIEPMVEDPPRTGTAEERNCILIKRWVVPERLEDGDPAMASEGANPPNGAWFKASMSVGTKPDASIQAFLPASDKEALPVARDTVLDWAAAHADAGKPSGPMDAKLVGVRGKSVRITPPDARQLRDNDLVWYRVERGAVSYFGRIRHGRWASRNPFAARTPAGHLAPPPPHLSPADRVFGTAGETRGGLVGKAQRDMHTARNLEAWAGRVRISTGRWQPPTTGEGPSCRQLTLSVLSSPKLQSAGLYLVRPDHEAVTWDPSDTEARLRGTKVYWHRDRIDTLDARTDQNKTVEVVDNGSFVADVSFEDLTGDELGALLLACGLRFDGDRHEKRGWKLGLGKPLGLGSVVNEVSDLVVYDLARRYDNPLTLGHGAAPAETGPFEEQARRLFLPNARDLCVLAGVSSHQSMRGRNVAYLGFRQPRRTSEGLSHHTPDAAWYLDCS